MVLSRLLAPCLSLSLVAACSADKETKPATEAAVAAADDGKAKKKSNVRKFESPVPYGKHVACPDLVDGAKFGPYLGTDIGEVKDKSSSNGEATSVCAFMRGGAAPTSNEQLRAFQKNNMKLGVLPGDEMCTVTAFCSYPVDLEEFKKKCEKDGNAESSALGQFACVRETQRASAFAYTYRVIDSETQCIFEVMGGPSVTDELVVQSCTKAALETIGPENIKTFF